MYKSQEITNLVTKKSKIGNAYKSILARTSRSKSADEDTTLEDRSDAAKALANIGIEVYDENGAYQDFSVTLDQLTEKWDGLTDAQREKNALSHIDMGAFCLRPILATI